SGQPATVHAELYGPFPERAAIVCSGTPIWTGSFDVTGNGEYRTPSYTVRMPGYYAYRDTIEAGDFVRSTQTACADTAETAVAVAKPSIRTRVQDTRVRPGESLIDTVTVTGVGSLELPVHTELFGPFPIRGAIRCSGKPYWEGTFTVTGSGAFETPAARVDTPGYYAFRESIAAGPANEAFMAACPETAETTVVLAAPRVTTASSAEVVRPGSAIFDHIRVQGLGQAAAAIEVQLYGPFRSRAAVRCTGRPMWQGRVYAK